VVNPINEVTGPGERDQYSPGTAAQLQNRVALLCSQVQPKGQIIGMADVMSVIEERKQGYVLDG
jgi:hypothetical protein